MTAAPLQTLLLVEDDASLRTTLAANLELEGYAVIEAETAERALQLLESQDFALVISDVRMAGMNGVELFRELKLTRPETPVVLMTAFTVEYLIKEAKREGIFTVLPKPVDFDYLASTIQRALRRPLVLFVDDDESVTESTVGVCELAGLRVMAAPNAEAALEALKKTEIDVIVVDLVLPGMNGAELVDAIRATRPEVSVIAISGYSVPEMMRRVAENGAFALMQKPFACEDLIEVIATARGACPIEPKR